MKMLLLLLLLMLMNRLRWNILLFNWRSVILIDNRMMVVNRSFVTVTCLYTIFKLIKIQFVDETKTANDFPEEM
jgi:hypothetical protein